MGFNLRIKLSYRTDPHLWHLCRSSSEYTILSLVVAIDPILSKKDPCVNISKCGHWPESYCPGIVDTWIHSIQSFNSFNTIIQFIQYNHSPRTAAGAAEDGRPEASRTRPRGTEYGAATTRRVRGGALLSSPARSGGVTFQECAPPDI